MCMCCYLGIYESLLLLNALTDLHQICCEGYSTKCPEIDGGGKAVPAPRLLGAARQLGQRICPILGAAALHCGTGRDGRSRPRGQSQTSGVAKPAQKFGLRPCIVGRVKPVLRGRAIARHWKQSPAGDCKNTILRTE